MDLPRRARSAITIGCMLLVAAPPAPSLGQQRDDADPANVCGLQRSQPADTDYSPADRDGTWRPRSDDECAPPPAAPPERMRDNGGPGLPGILGVIIAVVAGVLIAKALTGNRTQSVGDMMEEGPKAPGQELLGQYEVQGVVLPDWPLVVEVAADPDATTFVQIVPADARKDAVPPMVISDAGGAPWGERAVLRPVEIERTERGVLAKFDLPADLGSDRSGWRSARLSVLSGRVEDGEFVYRPLEVLALGCGPDAVGSAALQITRFEPAPQLRRASFTVAWNAKRRFENVDAELVQRTRTARSVTRKVLSRQDLCLAGQRDLCVSGPADPLPFQRVGEWPPDAGRQLEPGQSYHMQLRAWSGGNASGGWIVGQAPRTVAW